jgi:hypothetical protein
MNTKNQTQINPAPAGGIIYVYTQHESTIKIIEEMPLIKGYIEAEYNKDT